MLKSFLRGIVIGMANILPGISAGTMMVSMGIYDKMLNCVTHLFSKWKENITFLAPILVGAVIAILSMSFAIEPAFEHFPLQTNCLFIGLILGGIPALYANIKGDRKRPDLRISHVLCFLFFFAMIIVMALGENWQGSGLNVVLGTDLFSLVKLFFVGVIFSATMVIPGVSGTMVMLLIGYYNPMIETINGTVKALATLDFATLGTNVLILLPLGLGVLIGAYFIAKGFQVVFRKFPIHSYWSILGLVLASPFGILWVAGITTVTVWSILVGLIALVGGFWLAMKLGD